ncbi:MAG: HEAT repeat domain-containing protein [Bacteroidetes bacterium]|nr:HEAT repeat domain-containing protein [Bacteroidota bacterium]
MLSITMPMKHHHGKWGVVQGSGPTDDSQKKQPESVSEPPMSEYKTRLTKLQLKDLFFQLKDDVWVVRAQAVRKLGEILKGVKKEYNDEIIEKLGKLIPDKAHVSEPVIDILIDVGKKAVPMFMEGLDSKKYWPVTTSMRALGRIGEDAQEAIPKLIRLLNNKDDLIRYSAIETLGKINAIGVLPQLRKMATHNEDLTIRTFSKIAIERMTGKYPHDIPEWQPCSD